ncbi:MAG: 3-oxoacid CoA-transferase subunit B [Lachnospiraceae bacterium]|nr:3-oxoacid CoA-transferase subunit B [Lachnospiraceae bacterium]
MKKPENAREFIACRTAKFFKDGDVVNLGIGMPTLCLEFIPDDVDVWVDSENGIIGLGSSPKEGEIAPADVVDAGGNPSMMRVGAACFDSFRSFGYIRGGHVSTTVLGAYEVDAEGNLANWIIPGKAAAGMGGGMDLVTGAKLTIVMSTHCDKKGNPKFVQHTEIPLTGYHCVDYFVSELAVIHITPEGPVLEEIARSTTVEEVLSKTGCELIVPENVGYMD